MLAEVMGEPLLVQAWKCFRFGQYEEAKNLFQQIIKENDLRNTGIFGAFWGLGKIAAHEGKSDEAFRFYLAAVYGYPDQTREEHYVLISQMVEAIDNRGAETHSAAILQYAREVLDSKIGRTTVNGRKVGDQIASRMATLETEPDSAYRPRPIHERLIEQFNLPIHGINRVSEIVINRPSQIGEGDTTA